MISEKYPNKRIRIGGHSKGGNVAIYSAISAPNNIQKRIISVSNYDGPGFNRKIINTYKNSSILKKITTYLPQQSIIGRILDHEEECEFVESTEKGIYQHDVYSWTVLGSKITRVDKLTDSSDIFYKTVKDWLNNSTLEQRQIFFDSVFEIINSTSANTFAEISNSFIKNIPTLYKSLNEISDEDKKTITLMIRTFIKAYTTNFKDNKENNKLEKIDFKQIKNKIKKSD